MNVSRVTVGRVFNLGNYENVRYEITVDVPFDESAATALVALENIISALSPKTSTHSRAELEREKHCVDEMRKLLAEKGEEQFRRDHSHFVGTPEEYIQRCAESYEKNLAARDAWEAKSKKARQLLDALGGAANWKDAKQDWEDDTAF